MFEVNLCVRGKPQVALSATGSNCRIINQWISLSDFRSCFSLRFQCVLNFHLMSKNITGDLLCIPSKELALVLVCGPVAARSPAGSESLFHLIHWEKVKSSKFTSNSSVFYQPLKGTYTEAIHNTYIQGLQLQRKIPLTTARAIQESWLLPYKAEDQTNLFMAWQAIVGLKPTLPNLQRNECDIRKLFKGDSHPSWTVCVG